MLILSLGASFAEIVETVDSFLWGWPLIIFILAAGVFLSVRLVFVQVRKLPKAFRYMFRNEKTGDGQISAFSALCTALSATIGTGNIVGVATAICGGGPGALFWMIVAAFLGMATKYAECMLAVKYRKVDKDGHVLGGPFSYIETGMKERYGHSFKWLAVLFAIFGILVGLLGIGTFTQINSITSAVDNVIASPTLFTVGSGADAKDITLAVVIAGVVLTVLVGAVILGGAKRISKVATLVVPFMAVVYVLFCLIVLFTNITAIPAALRDIVVSAFNPQAVAGGISGTLVIAMQKGIARGIFSNEAGLGSAPIAAARAQTKEPVRQGLVSMLGTFIDTIIICLMTGTTIVITGAWQPTLGLEGVQVTIYAFANGLPGFLSAAAPWILSICLIFFAYTTILGWDFYSESCLEYLVGRKRKAILAFRWVYLAAVFFGPYMAVATVWNIADIVNGLMAIPNLIGVVALSGVVVKDTKEYFARLKSGEIDDKKEPPARIEETEAAAEEVPLEEADGQKQEGV